MSALPFLFVGQVVFLLLLGHRASPAAIRAAIAIATAMTAWGVATGWFACSGLYDTPPLLAMLPGLWLPALPFALVAATSLSRGLRAGLADLASTAPANWLVAVQALRIAALGTLLHTTQGTFPLHVELAIGLTDLAFGLSAVWVFLLMRDRGLHPDALAVWHLTGMAIILVPGMISLQLGLPGPLRAVDVGSSEAMLDWPMALGPTLVVPCFLLLNLLGAVAAWRRRTAPDTRSPT